MVDFSSFPYEVVETTSKQAFADWQTLKTAGRGTPVILGDDFENLLFPFSSEIRPRLTPVDEILSEAAAIKFPDDLFKLYYSDEEHPAKAVDLSTCLETWPAPPRFLPDGPSVAFGLLKDEPRPDVYIALIPTDDATAIPAYMQWGSFNECPPSAFHVAALRAWRDRYGAELVGLNADFLNLRVTRTPETREEALELARVMHAYCSDLISNPVPHAYQEVAANLMKMAWWSFWWD